MNRLTQNNLLKTAWLLGAIVWGVVCSLPAFAETPTVANLKVAFIGDSGDGTGFGQVLQLIKNEGTATGVPVELILHQGDFSYSSGPTSGWTGQINTHVGNIPYLGSDGNHDDWAQYYSGFFNSQISSLQGKGGTVSGNPSSSNYAAVYKGLKMVFVQESGNATYLNQELQADDHTWKVCSWHKNRSSLQLGTKGDEVDVGSYNACRQQGAIIVTGHEHSYERTKTISYDFNILPTKSEETANGFPDNLPLIDPECPNDGVMCVEPGKTFVVVSGLAGTGIRNQDRCSATAPSLNAGCVGVNPQNGNPASMWAKMYTSDQGAKFGALFITFNVDGDPNKARGYFKNIDGQVIDSFEITKGSGIGTPDTTPPVISGVSSSGLSASGATINWTTNEASDSQVEYGLTTAYGVSTVLNSSMVTSHSVQLMDLGMNKLYHYRVKSRDAAGNLGTSGDFTFTTNSNPNRPPTINSFGNNAVDRDPAVSGIQVYEGDTVTYSATASDPDGDPLIWNWYYQINNGSAVSFKNGSGQVQSATYTYPVGSAGSSYLWKLEVSDGQLSAQQTVTVSVISQPLPPPGSCGEADAILKLGQVQYFQALATNEPTGEKIRYEFDWGDGRTTVTEMVNSNTPKVVSQSWLTEKIYDVKVKAVDAAGGISVWSDSLSICVDSTPPLITDVSATAITTTSSTITWKTNEPADSQVEFGETMAYGTLTPIISALITNHSLAIQGLSPNTTYHFRVKSRDAATNLATSGDFTFTTAIDVLPPEYKLTVDKSSVNPGEKINVSWEVKNANVGSTDWIAMYGVNEANQSTNFIQWIQPQYYQNLGGQPTGSREFTVPLLGSVPGQYEFRYLPNNGYTSAAKSAVVTVNPPAPPTINITSPLIVNADEDITAQWTASSVGPQDWVGVFVDGTPDSSGYQEGLWVAVNGRNQGTVTFKAPRVSQDTIYVVRYNGDGVNAIKATSPQKVTVKAAPNEYVINITSSLPVNVGEDVVVQWVVPTEGPQDWVGLFVDGTLDSSGYQEGLWVAMSNVSGNTYTFKAPRVSQDTIYVARYNGQGVNAIKATSTQKVTIKAAPNEYKIDITTPTQVKAGEDVSVKWIVPIVGPLDWIGLFEVGQPNSEYRPGLWITAKDYPNGEYTFSAPNELGKEYEARYNGPGVNDTKATSSQKVTISIVDTISPSVSIISPLNGSTVSGTIDVMATAQDNVGVVGVQFNLDGVPLEAEDLISPYMVSWDTTTVTVGSHVLTAVARDAAENSTISASVSVIVPDTTPPVISDISAVPIENSVTIHWTTDEPADTQVNYGLTNQYGIDSPLIDTTTKVTSHQVTLLELTPATTYHYRVNSKDAGGNPAISSDQTFRTLDAVNLGCPTLDLYVMSYDSHILYFNENLVPSSTGGVGVTHYELPLQPGDNNNLIAIKATEQIGHGGLLVEGDQCGEKVISNADWKHFQTDSELNNALWTKKGYADGAWPQAVSYGRAPAWCNSQTCNFPDFPTAEWLWSSNSLAHNQIYFRHKFTAKGSSPGDPVPPTLDLPTLELTADSTTITVGGETTLHWNSTNAASCSATWTASQETSGSQSVNPTTTTDYSMTCTGAGGSVSATTKVTVVDNTPGTVTLNVGPKNLEDETVRIHPGDDIVVTWDTSRYADRSTWDWVAIYKTGIDSCNGNTHYLERMASPNSGWYRTFTDAQNPVEHPGIDTKIFTTLNTMPPGEYEVRFLADFTEFDCKLVAASTTKIIVLDPAAKKVRINNRRLEVDFDGDGVYLTYHILGVNYSPYPIGTFPGGEDKGTCRYIGKDNFGEDQFNCKNEGEPYIFDVENAEIMDRDFLLLEVMNANTIRTWDKVTETLLNKAEDHGLKVIAGFPVDSTGDLKTRVKRQEIIDAFGKYVQDFKDYPALLFWAIGDGNNFHLGNNSPFDWYSLVNDMAKKAREIEGSSYHPIAIVNGDIDYIGSYLNNAGDAQLTHIDIWGINAYRGGETFGDLFGKFRGGLAKSTKPIWISEFGTDAWKTIDPNNPQGGQEDQQGQVDSLIGTPNQVGLWGEIVANDDLAIGGTLMAYSDEWWRNDGQSNESCSLHGYGGVEGGVLDGFINEEWWGIMAVEDNDSGPDIMHPRRVYGELQSLFSLYR